MPKRVSQRNAAPEIVARRDFSANALTGKSVSGSPYPGRLAKVYADKLAADNPTYVVSSYATPIAWHGDQGWVVPEQKHSQTTSTHQGIVRRALSQEFSNGHDGARV